MKFYLSTAALTLLGGTGGELSSTWLEAKDSRAALTQASGDGSAQGESAPIGSAGAGRMISGLPGSVRDALLDARLEEVLRLSGIPGAVGAIVQLGTATRVGVAGVRKAGNEAFMTADDLVHIGSDTKAMTAVLVARLVQQGKLEWDSTIAGVLPSIADSIHSDFRDVTIADLLRHLAGLPANPANWSAFAGKDLRARRLRIAEEAMSSAPLSRPGKEHLYSNLSVMIAGAMAEAAADAAWEDLMRSEVFLPLGMEVADFGIPGTPGQTDQPWGHRPLKDGSFAPVQLDNDPALGPAGTVHLSMADWARFVTVFLEDAGSDGAQAFLSPESRKALLAPGPGGEYGMGWLLLERGWAKGQALSHSGTNTSWYATAWVAPEIDVAFLVAANAYGPDVSAQLDAFISQCVLGMLAERASGNDRADDSPR